MLRASTVQPTPALHKHVSPSAMDAWGALKGCLKGVAIGHAVIALWNTWWRCPSLTFKPHCEELQRPERLACAGQLADVVESTSVLPQLGRQERCDCSHALLASCQRFSVLNI